MSNYEIILITIGVMVCICALVGILCMIKDANELIYKSNKMKDWSKEEMKKRKNDEGNDMRGKQE